MQVLYHAALAGKGVPGVPAGGLRHSGKAGTGQFEGRSEVVACARVEDWR